MRVKEGAGAGRARAGPATAVGVWTWMRCKCYAQTAAPCHGVAREQVTDSKCTLAHDVLVTRCNAWCAIKSATAFISQIKGARPPGLSSQVTLIARAATRSGERSACFTTARHGTTWPKRPRDQPIL